MSGDSMSKVITLKLGFANAFLIRDKGTILVDTGINTPREHYVRLFRDLQVDPQTLDLIVITHGHADHFGNAYILKELTPAPVLCHSDAVQALQTGQSAEVIPRNELGRNVFKRLKRTLPLSSKPVRPDLIIDSIFDLKPYGVRGKVVSTPGHSACSVSVILDSGKAIVGDIFVPSPLTGAPCLAYFACDETALFESARFLLGQAEIFYGGHGPSFSKEELVKFIRQLS